MESATVGVMLIWVGIISFASMLSWGFISCVNCIHNAYMRRTYATLPGELS